MPELSQLGTLAQFGAGVYIAYSLFPGLRVPHLKMESDQIDHVLDQSGKKIKELSLKSKAAKAIEAQAIENLNHLRHRLVLSAARVDYYTAFLHTYDSVANIYCVINAVLCIALLVLITILPTHSINYTLTISAALVIGVPILLQLVVELCFIGYFLLFVKRETDALEGALEDMLGGT